jgi:hypothetical protein
MSADRENLLRETEWLRVYRVGEKELRYESKCLSEGLQISANSIKSTWAKLSPQRRLEFTIAFGAIHSLSSEDEEILNFLMEVGEVAVLSNLATQYAKHSDRERVLPFLLGQIKPSKEGCANFLQALELMKDSRALPGLRTLYKEYRTALEKALLNQSQVFDYLQCCRTLLILDRSPEFRRAIEEMLDHPVEMIRHRAAQLLA